MHRREFLKFLGLSLGSLYFSGCTKLIDSLNPKFSFKALEATTQDDLVIAEGFSYDIIRSWQDPINKSEYFGTNNDYTAFFELEKNKALLWVNHEEIDIKLIPEYSEQRKATGGSVIAIEKIKNKWQFSEDEELQEKYNRRYDANSYMKFTGPTAKKLESCRGTLANCSGGVTPWNTVLTCEENFDYFPDKFGWHNFNRDYYGWVVEIDPLDKNFTPRKHTALGKFAHENATITLCKDKKAVVYMGDDHENEHIYKYVSNKTFEDKEQGSELLTDGKLYVAKLNSESQSGEWLLLDIANPLLKDKYANQGELLLNTREAAKAIGATEMNRPEDLEINPYDNSILVALTKNFSKNDPHGSILKIKEKDDNYSSLEFSYEYFSKAGPELGLSCPDNLCFDQEGNLWVTTDISAHHFDKEQYKYHGNNSLFVIPVQGPEAGKPKRFVSAPRGAELTGPSFSKDYKTLFLSVQHPGEGIPSSWPNSSPSSSVVAINLK